MTRWSRVGAFIGPRGMIKSLSGKNLGKNFRRGSYQTDNVQPKASERRLKQWQKASDKKGISLAEYIETFVGNVSTTPTTNSTNDHSNSNQESR